MNTIILLVQSLVGLGFLFRATGNLAGFERARARFKGLRLGRTARWSLGLLELLGGVGMLIALTQPFLVFFVSVFLALTSAGTLLLQYARQSLKGSLMLGFLLLGSLVAGALQPLGLKVLALPKADTLPVDTVASARLVKAYDEGLWFEGVAVGPDGTIYLSGNKGENYATGDKSQVQARIIARAPDGSERVFFELPRGATSGVIAFDHQGRMYMTGQGAKLGVWRLTPDGKGELFAKLPQGAWPNGMTAGPDGKLYVADSSMGVIWRIDPVSGAVERAVESDALRRRPFIALAPGANGIHFFGKDLYVTVSDAARVLKFRLENNGTLSAPTVFAEGIPGDDFAIDSHGTLYITTHIFNTIVRVTQDGKRSIIANATQGIVGATDAVFGARADDQDTLYVVTDGGALEGNLKARGTLVALKIKNDPPAANRASAGAHLAGRPAHMENKG